MHILKVIDVDTSLMKSNPPILVINAYGVVATLGWSNPRLEPRYYIEFPADGIQDFDFVADPPTGMVPQVITPIAAQIEWDNPPEELKGVRIHAQTNNVEHLLGGSSKEISLT